ncbi:hypothetical protein VB264_21265 [Arcicella aquatica]|uniref:DUF3987 domain-containing protein n=1 Tax=Arcicella aquatica TaxID=217141 RepID=A0ABU5QTJ8_9BACT|nr:hypothetical protein [Arcicella aquatica]MEA5260343.1 hypothetical protein [Arcicella aquatica]
MEQDELIEINEKILLEQWSAIFPNLSDISLMAAEHNFIANFKSAVAEEEKIVLNLNSRGWKIHLRRALFKSTLSTSLTVAILSLTDFLQLTTTIVSMIVPIIFDIEAIEITRREEEIYLSLPLHRKRKKFMTTDEWYDSLPTSIKEEIKPLAFIEFMEKLVAAGLAKSKEGKYLVLKKGKEVFKFNIC